MFPYRLSASWAPESWAPESPGAKLGMSPGHSSDLLLLYEAYYLLGCGGYSQQVSDDPQIRCEAVACSAVLIESGSGFSSCVVGWRMELSCISSGQSRSGLDRAVVFSPDPATAFGHTLSLLVLTLASWSFCWSLLRTSDCRYVVLRMRESLSTIAVHC